MRALARTLAAALPCARRLASESVAPALGSLADPKHRTTLLLAAAGSVALAAAVTALLDGARLRRRVAVAETDVKHLKAQVVYVQTALASQGARSGWRGDRGPALPSGRATRIPIH